MMQQGCDPGHHDGDDDQGNEHSKADPQPISVTHIVAANQASWEQAEWQKDTDEHV